MKSLGLIAALLLSISETQAADVFRGSLKDDSEPVQIEVCNCWSRVFFSAGIGGNTGGHARVSGKGFHTTKDISDYSSLERTGAFSGRGVDADRFQVGGGVSVGYDRSFGSRFFWGGVGDVWQVGGRLRGNGSRAFDWGYSSQRQLATYSFDVAMPVVATLRARFGIVHDRSMFYLTAGPALGWLKGSADLKTSFEYNDGVNLVPQYDIVRGSSSRNELLVGYALGAGGEWSISRKVAIGAEYLYTSLSTTMITQARGMGPYGNSAVPFQVQSDFAGHSVRLNLTYQIAMD